MKKFFIFLFILIICAGILIGFLPSIASSEWGKNQIVHWVNRSIPGKIEIQELDLSWGKGQKIGGLKLKDPIGKTIVQIEKISTEGSLWQLVQNSTHLGHTQLINLNGSIESDANGVTNLQKALGKETSFDSVRSSSIQLKEVQADLFLFSENHPLSIQINGKTVQEALIGSFEFDIRLPASLSSKWETLQKELQSVLTMDGSKEAKIQAKIVQFPIALIDQLVSLSNPHLKGFFLSLLGDRLDLTMEKQSGDELAFHLLAQSPLMKGSFNGKVANGAIVLQEPAQFQFQLTPQFVNPQTNGQVKLLEPSLFHFNITSFTFPLALFDSEAELEKYQFEWTADASLPKTTADISGFGKTTLLNSEAKLHMASGEPAALNFDTQITKGGESFQLHSDSTFSLPSRFKDLLSHILQNLNGNFKISQLPLPFIPQLAQQKELLDWIGTPLDLSITIHSKKGDNWEMLLSLQTPLIKIDQAVLNLNGSKFPNFSEELKGQLTILDAHHIAFPFLSDPLSFVLIAKGKWMEEIAFARLTFNNQLFNGKIEGRLPSLSHAELTQAAYLNLNLTPALLSEIRKKMELNVPDLKEEAHIHLTVQPTTADFASLNTLQLKGLFSIDQLRLQDSSLNQISLPWEFNGQKHQVGAELKGFVQLVDQRKTPFSSKINFKFSDGNYSLNNASGDAQFYFDQIPVPFFTSFITQNDLVPLIGPTLNLNMKSNFNLADHQPGFIDVLADSSNFTMQGKFKWDQSLTLTDTPPSFIFHLTQSGFETLKSLIGSTHETKLKSAVTIKGMLSQFNFPLKMSVPASIDFDFSTTDIQWEQSSSPPLQLKGRLFAKNGMDKLQFELETGASLAINGSIAPFLKKEGGLQDLSSAEIQVSGDGKKLPPSLFQTLALGDPKIGQKIQALFGETVDLHFNGKIKNLSGPLQASLIGPEAQIVFDGQLSRGVLTLNKPLEGSLNPTPLFVQTYLAPYVPLLSSALGSEKAIKFSLSPDKFYFPLFPFQLVQVNIGSGMIDLGKINFRNQGELSSVLSFIHTVSDPTFTIWFTPINFNLSKGILNLKRLDMLVANSYTVATWGSLNLNLQQADLILGLSGKSLEYAFGVQGLGEKYMLQIPLRSANGKVELDKKKATARITALIAQSKGGPEGKLLGNILDAALSIGDSSPPPTQPFPWKDQFKQTTETTSQHPEQKKKKHKSRKEKENPLNDITDGATQVLDLLFGQPK